MSTPSQSSSEVPDEPAGSPEVAGPADRTFAAPRTAASVHVVVVRDDGATSWAGTDPHASGLADALADEGARVWIDLEAATAEQVHAVAGILGLHELLAEDILERNQRPKAEVVEDVLHLVFFSLAHEGRVFDREIDFVLGRRFLLSSHSRWWNPNATHHLRLGPVDLLRRGPDRLLWALIDDTVDAYFPVLDVLGDEIDDVQDSVVGDPRRETLERLFVLKRELIAVRRVTAPEREMLNLLTNRQMELIGVDQTLYFRDVYDHLIRLTDELDNYRELVSGTLDVYLSTVNNNLSLIMKRLTGVTVIVAGMGAIAGIFGMSEAGAAFKGAEAIGFWLVTLGTVALALLAGWVLRRIGWI